MSLSVMYAAKLTSNQAYWLLCRVLPASDDATRVLRDSKEQGADWGPMHHVTYHKKHDTYDVIIDLGED